MTAGYADDLLREAMRRQDDRRIAAPRRRGDASNPLCGDEIELDIDDDGTVVTDLAHRVRGCVFTRASASLLARTVTGLRIEDALALAATLGRDLAGTAELPADVAALASVRIYPARVKCALLPWDALATGLADR